MSAGELAWLLVVDYEKPVEGKVFIGKILLVIQREQIFMEKKVELMLFAGILIRKSNISLFIKRKRMKILQRKKGEKKFFYFWFRVLKGPQLDEWSFSLAYKCTLNNYWLGL